MRQVHGDARRSHGQKQDDISSPYRRLHLFPSRPPPHASPHLGLTPSKCMVKTQVRGSVSTRLSKLTDEVGEDEHAIVFCTHEAMMATDLSGFAGWHLRIDEVPQSVSSGVITVSETIAYFEANYDLELIPGSPWAEVRRRGEQANWKAVADDDLAKSVGEFAKLAGRSGLFVDVRSWEQVGERGKLGWVSVWTPLALTAFESVTIAAASPRTSLCVRAWAHLLGPELTFHDRVIPSGRKAWPTVQIHYFTAGHEGSTSFWATPEGRRCIAAVSRHLERVPDIGFWSANESVRLAFEGRLSGEALPPKVAGINACREARSCAIIYSAKPTPGDQPLFDLLDLSSEAVRTAREDEDIAQFVLRGAIRNPDFSGVYEVWLYSLRQAEALRDYLIGNDIAVHVELTPCDEAGIMGLAREGRTQPTQESGSAKRDRKRQQDADRQRRRRAKQADATGRAPGVAGRPPLR